MLRYHQGIFSNALYKAMHRRQAATDIFALIQFQLLTLSYRAWIVKPIIQKN